MMDIFGKSDCSEVKVSTLWKSIYLGIWGVVEGSSYMENKLTSFNCLLKCNWIVDVSFKQYQPFIRIWKVPQKAHLRNIICNKVTQTGIIITEKFTNTNTDREEI